MSIPAVHPPTGLKYVQKRGMIQRAVGMITRQLAHASYEMSLGPLTQPAFNNLSRALHRKETTDLRRSQVEINQQQLTLTKERVALEQKRLELEIRQFEYHAVEQAAKHAAQLNAIGDDPSLNDRQKYLLARDVLFGPSPQGSPPVSAALSGGSPDDPLPPDGRNRREEILTQTPHKSSPSVDSPESISNSNPALK